VASARLVGRAPSTRCLAPLGGSDAETDPFARRPTRGGDLRRLSKLLHAPNASRFQSGGRSRRDGVHPIGESRPTSTEQAKYLPEPARPSRTELAWFGGFRRVFRTRTSFWNSPWPSRRRSVTCQASCLRRTTSRMDADERGSSGQCSPSPRNGWFRRVVFGRLTSLSGSGFPVPVADEALWRAQALVKNLGVGEGSSS
jgi:hypothetical protein